MKISKLTVCLSICLLILSGCKRTYRFTLYDVLHSIDGKPEQTEPVDFFLTVKAPAGARVRILNIRPKYKDHILLRKGSYHIEVSKRGYQTKKKWIRLDDDLTMTVTLDKLAVSPHKNQHKVSKINSPGTSHTTHVSKKTNERAANSLDEKDDDLSEKHNTSAKAPSNKIVLYKPSSVEQDESKQQNNEPLEPPSAQPDIEAPSPRASGNKIVLNKQQYSSEESGPGEGRVENAIHLTTKTELRDQTIFVCEFYCVGNLGGYRGNKHVVDIKDSNRERAEQEVIKKNTRLCEKLPYYKEGGGKALVGPVYCFESDIK